MPFTAILFCTDNIAAWSRQIAPRPGGAGGQVFDGQLTGEQFTYDELNRVKSSTFQSLTGAAAAGGAYQTTYGYDPNGNLLSLTRNGQDGQAIDNLTYRYNREAAGGLTNNKLRGVGDVSGQALGVVNQAATDNYTYDEIGNLTADAQDGISIEWSVYGKVKTVTKTDGSQTIAYLYDASGNRTVKTVRTVNLQTNVATIISTYYVRDAQGNVLAVYDDNGSALAQRELYLYGSSRLGIYRPGANRTVATNGIYTRSLTRKEYELTDHLGNVRAVIGDYRESDGNNPVRAALRSYANYYAFGLEMPGMSWKGNGYRYGYNGKEQDRETETYDYGARMYDSGVGRWWSLDPLASQFAAWSPYNFAINNPLNFIDEDGQAPRPVHPFQVEVHLIMNYPQSYVEAIRNGKGVGFDALANVVNGGGNFNRIVGAFAEGAFAKRIQDGIRAWSPIFGGVKGAAASSADINVYMSPLDPRYREIDVLQTTRVKKNGSYTYPLLTNLSGKENPVTLFQGDYTFLYEVKATDSDYSMINLTRGMEQLIEIMDRNKNSKTLIPILVADAQGFREVLRQYNASPNSKASKGFISAFNTLANKYHGGVNLEEKLKNNAKEEVIKFKTDSRKTYGDGASEK